MNISESFFTPIVFTCQHKTFKQKVIEACDDFFYYGGRKISVLADKNIALSETQNTAITGLKIALCFTGILPALCLLGKALLRPKIYLTPISLSEFSALFSAPYNETKGKEHGLTPSSLHKLQSLHAQIHQMSEACQFNNHEFIQNVDLQKLFGTTWLNDTCIDEYLKLLIKNQPGFCLCSVMVVKLALDRPDDRALNLARIRTHDGKKLSSLFDTPKKVLIPINTGLHWALMVFNTDAKTVHYYDSIAKKHLPTGAAIICSQLENLANCSLKVINMGKNCPQQTNSSDCGVFTLLAASHIIQNRLLTYTQDDAPYMRAKILSDFCGFC